MSNKFGMFIHWGVYSIDARHEQALAKYSIPFEEYDKMAMEFNPTEYDPEEWVLLAKKCGMEYITFTAKHHDGFYMWDTKTTDYNIMNTRYAKDVLKMLSDACHKHGMLLSIYYSNPDWHHENAYNPLSSHQYRARNKDAADMDKYKQYIKAQIKELLTNYGEIYTLFWDIPPKIYDPSMNEYVRELMPSILINNRGFDEGDFSTPEREVPQGKRFERMTEACQSLGEQSWGFREDEDYYSKRYLLSSIDKIMAMGGSYLINGGPMPNGKFNKDTTDRFLALGDWYRRMGGVLEDSEADDTGYTLAGKNEYIATKKNGKTYFHFYNGLISSAVHFFECGGKIPKSARLMNSGEPLRLCYDPLPGLSNPDGTAKEVAFSIKNIAVDTYCDEPVVIEVEWK